MVTYTDTYVEMLQEDLQHQYRRLFEVGNDLVRALGASEGKDLEISTMKNFLDSSELTLSDALRTVSVRDIEIERLTFALKDKDEELAKERRKRSELQCDVIFKNQELMSFEDRIAELVHTLSNRDIEIERLTFALKDKDEELAKERDKTSRMQSEEIAKLENLLDRSDETLIDTLKAVSDQSIEIERLTFALKDKDNELESVRDEHRTQIDELMEEIERLTRRNKKPFKVAELRDSIYKQQQSIDALWNYVKSIAAHINTGSSQENP